MPERIIGQKWKVHNFQTVAERVPQDGELMCVRHPDQPDTTVPLMGNGKSDIAALYEKIISPPVSDLGVWTTPYSNGQVLFDSTWAPYKYHNTGIKLEDATTYNIIISAMAGSITGETNINSNNLIPVLLNGDGTLFAHIIDASQIIGCTMTMKAFYNFRAQFSKESENENMLFLNSLLDISLGTVTLTSWPSADRKTAALSNWEAQFYQNAGPAVAPVFIPAEKNLYIGVGLPEGSSEPPNCSARMLVKVERLRGVEASV